MENIIELKTISDLLGMNFFIPSYQRGFRWNKQQVEDLLNDIIAFARKKNKTNKEFYCLQPIVVKEHKWFKTGIDGLNKEINGWEVIDGQQRLTTIRILFSYIIKKHLNGNSLNEDYGKNVFSIDYETRENMETFIDQLNMQGDDSNIDLYYISQAYNNIEEWFKKQEKQRDVREALLRTLVYGIDEQQSEGIVQVIWYQIEDDTNPIDTFIRINLGKISLTNSELIKALFLQKRNFGNENEITQLRQIEIANEWDRIENALQDDDFWWFLNKDKNEMPARIEFIFNLMCSVAKKNDPEIEIRKELNSQAIETRKIDHPSLEEKIGTDRYATFRFFNEKFDAEVNYVTIKKEWDKVKEYFLTFEEWFNNPIWYHYIGFLVFCGEDIAGIYTLCKKDNVTKNDITTSLKKKVKSCFKSIKWALDEHDDPYIDLSFSSSNKHKIRELLLFFNLEYIVRQCVNNTLIYKFPFKTFKDEDWDVEHIDSYTSNSLKDKTTQLEWIITAKKDLKIVGALSERITNFIENNVGAELFETLRNEIAKLAGEDETDSEIKNNIGNLALLDYKTNRSYGNSLFTTKRKIIIEKDSS